MISNCEYPSSPRTGAVMSFSCPPPADLEALLERTGLKPGEGKFYDEIG